MFENLSDRERKLLIAVGSLAPFVLAFIGFFWFIDSYNQNEDEIQDLLTRIEEQDDKTRAGLLAAQRQRYYRKASLPSDKGRARSVYQNWLDKLVTEEVGMTYKGTQYKDNGFLRYNNSQVARREIHSINVKGTFAQLLSLLHAIHSADHLHRINKLVIKPVTKIVRGKPPALTGELRVAIDIEILQLNDGPADLESFPRWRREMRPVEEYEQVILSRNIFGPANNAPKLSKPKKLEFTIAESAEAADGKYATVQIEATDADKEDMLSFELVEESGKKQVVEGIVLGDQPRTASQRKISIRIPMQFEPLTVPLTVAVSDSGLPSKGDELAFRVKFVKPPTKPKKDPPPKPIDLATVTFVRGLMRGVDGKWNVLVHIQTKSKSHQLASGDTLELDSKTWQVVDVNKQTVTFEVDGVRKSYTTDSPLSQPMQSDAQSKTGANAKQDAS